MQKYGLFAIIKYDEPIRRDLACRFWRHAKLGRALQPKGNSAERVNSEEKCVVALL